MDSPEFNWWFVIHVIVGVFIMLTLVFVAPFFVQGTTENEELNEFEAASMITEDGSEFVFDEDTIIDVQQKTQFRNLVTETRYDADSRRVIVRLNHLDMYNVSTISDADDNDTVLVFTQYYEYNESSQNVEEYQLKRIYGVDESSFLDASELNYDVSEYSYYDGECQINTTAVVSHSKNARSDRATGSSGRILLYKNSQFLKYSVIEPGSERIVQLKNGWYSHESYLSYRGDGVAHVTNSDGRVVAEDIDSSANLRAGNDYAGDNDKKYVVRDANFSATITLYDKHETYPVIKWWDSQTVEARHTVDERKTDVSITRPEWANKYDSSCG